MNAKLLINRLLKKIFTPKLAAYFLLSLPSKLSAEKKVSEMNFIGDSEFSVTSQHGEDGVLLFLMSRLSKTLTFAEIGAHACESNCLFSAKTLKIKGVFFEASARHCEEGNRFMKMVGVNCKFAQNFITPGTVNDVLKKEGMTKLDIFSLDVDGHDYFILQAHEFKPRIIIVEYNSAIDFNHGAATLPLHKEPAGDLHGASLAAFQKLLSDYSLVYCEKSGVNAFFVREDLMHHFLDDQVFPHLVPNRGRDNFSPDIKHGEFEKV